MERLLDLLEDMKGDENLSKGVSDNISKINEIVSSKEDMNIKKDKIIQLLERISTSQSLDSYSRTQLLNLISEAEAKL